MEIRIDRDVLVDAVNWVSRTLPKTSTNPLQSGILFEVDREHTNPLRLSTTDGESSSQIHVHATVTDPATLLISGQLFSTVVRALPSAPVVLTSSDSGVVITCGRTTFRVPTINPDNYPAIPSPEDELGMVSGPTFAAAVAQVAVAAGRIDARPVLACVRIEVDGPTITLAATDRYRLGVRQLDWTPSKPGVSAAYHIPAKTLQDIARPLSACETVRLTQVLETVTSSEAAEASILGFEGDQRRTTTRLMDGRDFPPYGKIMPTTSNTVVTVDTAGLIEVVKRVSLMTDSRSRVVRLTFADGELTADAGMSADATAADAYECRTKGEGMATSFNADYLLDGLNGLNAPVVEISMTEAVKPVVIQGLASHEGEPTGDFRYLLMPMQR